MNAMNQRSGTGFFGRWSRWAACGAAAIAGAWAIMPAVQAVQPATAAPVKAPAAENKDLWYSVSLGGGHAGYQRIRVSEADGKITTEIEMKISIGRKTQAVNVKKASTFVETKDHKPVMMRSIDESGSKAVITEYTFEKDAVKIVTVQGDQKTEQTKDAPSGVWLTPAAADIYLAERQAAGAKEIVVRAVDPASGLEPLTTTYTLVESSTMKALGKDVPVKKYSQKLSNFLLRPTSWLDETGSLVKFEMPMGAMTITMTASTREEALKEGEAPEMMVATFVKPEGTVQHPRQATKGVYVLTLPEGELPVLPTGGGQSSTAIDKASAEVTVSSKDFAEADAKDATDQKYLAASAVLNCGDSEIKKLAEEALAKAPAGKPERAEALRRFVYSYITAKNLGTGFDTASQVARTKSGDCTEHAVLLAALLRADGVPSRCVSGLIFADEFAGARKIFGYHMWAQALLDKGGKKRWVDLDGTLPPATPFDATHIALVGSALGDGDFEKDMAGMVSVLGRLKIQVKECK